MTNNPNTVHLTDTDTIKFGKHKGKKLINVPADYLLWLYDQDWFPQKYPSLYRYVQEHYDLLVDEANERRNLGAG